ncbi:MAG: hypothetical protein DRG27_06635 [Deltaproteobacteria bacterium]|nr:MAG: hypothetical protein DRG27_06635 [Deltaproteobacteria bacterium]
MRNILALAEGGHILRRYFVMNGFDGALTALGIIIAAMVAQPEEPTDVLFMGIGASIAMGVSGVWIAYLTERAERTRELKELEAQMLSNLKDTNISRANSLASIVISFVDGFSPFLFSILSISPFFLVIPHWISMNVAYIIAIILVFLEITLLGVFLGAISKENKILYALKIIPAGIITAGLTLLLELFNGH